MQPTLIQKSLRNPFAYFTQITYYAFLRRIQREKKQDQDIKYKLMEAADAKGELAAMLDPEKMSKDPYADYLKLTENDIVNIEPKKFSKNYENKRKKEKSQRHGGTESYFEDCDLV